MTKNSQKEVKKDYLRTLVCYSVFTPKKLGNVNMYLKSEVDTYIVEGQGDKLAHKRRAHANKQSGAEPS